MYKPLNILAFLLGLSLAFVPFAHSIDTANSTTCETYDCSFAENQYGQHYCVAYDSGSGEVFDHQQDGPYFYDPYLYDGSFRYGIISKGSYNQPCESYGYVETPPEPAVCSDGVKSEGETGIDCGGECSDACDSSICENASAILVDNLCEQQSSPDAFGNCPSGTTLKFTESANVCSTSPVPPIQYFSGDVSTDPYDDFTLDPEPTIDPFEAGQFSIVENLAAPITVDNGDGTSTVSTTTTTTTTNNQGDTSTSTTVNSYNIDNATGDKIAGSESNTIEDEVPVETTPLIASPDGLDFGDRLTDVLDSASSEFESYVDDVQGSDLVQHFTDVFTLPADTGGSPLTLSMGSYGVHLVDSQMMDTTLSLVGQVLVVCAFIAGAYIVFRKQ